MFQQNDVNGDGVVTVEEFKQASGCANDKDDSSSEKYQIDHSDYQAGGCSGVSGYCTGSKFCKISIAAIAACETNNKPGLTWEETSACTTKFADQIKHHQIPLPTQAMFQQNDVNGDGVVTVEEFKQASGCANDKDDSSSEKYQIDHSDYQAGGGSGVSGKYGSKFCQISIAAIAACE